MADKKHDSSANEKPKPGAEPGRPAGVDYSRYRMNPVQIEESVETAHAAPRRIGVSLLVAAVLVVAVLAVLFWNRLTAQRPPLESLDPEVRAHAKELVDNILTRIESLQGYVYDVAYPSPDVLQVYINPTITSKSGQEHAITGPEIERATKRVTEEFRGYGKHGAKLTVLAYVAEHPSEARSEQPSAVGTYDPETESVGVRLTARVTLPQGRGTGEALPPPSGGHFGRPTGPAEEGR